MTCRSFYIGKYEIRGGILAPMAGYTDIAFRELCKECGAGLTVTEMVSVRGLDHGNKATRELMRLSPFETPSCVQVFGSNPDDFSRAAEVIESDIIDVNMGCPMPKIVKNGDGAALLNDPKRAGDIVRALVNATDKPITVKTRLGYNTGNNQAAELIESVEQAGAAAVAVHGRYAEQRYAGNADYSEIEKIARTSSIPIIVNGDLTDCEAKPPFAAVMIGRAALNNPAVFSGKESNPFEIARRHLELLTKYFDERYTVIQARKFFVHYFKGMRGGKALRDEVNRAVCVKEVLTALDRAERTVI
ncbi:MAG: tRNA-dihydrouridine synthase [Clostridiales bacterium]|nr:tRNA-dihydrouridine synthase [Clostridiales bacterium]